MTSTPQQPPDTPVRPPGTRPSRPSLPVGYTGDTTPCALCGQPAPAAPVPAAGRLPGISIEHADTAGHAAPLCQPCLEHADHDGRPLARRQAVTATFLVHLDVDIGPVDGEGRWRDDDPREPLAEDIADELREHLAYQHPEPGDLVQEIHSVAATPTPTAAVRQVLDRIERHAEQFPVIQAAVEAAETSGNLTQTERATDARDAHYVAQAELLYDLLAALKDVSIQ